MSDGLNHAVAAFAQGRPPAGPSLPDWPRYQHTDRAAMVLDATPHIEFDPRPAERWAWQNRSWPSGTCWAIDDLGGVRRPGGQTA